MSVGGIGVNTLSSQQLEELASAVLSVMPGWEFLMTPQGFGWAPDRHFRAQLTKGDQVTNVIIRQSWSVEGYQVELFLYRSVFPYLVIRTPKLWGAFELDMDTSRWMVLEDLGKIQPRGDRVENRETFLHVLGSLHGQGILLSNRLSGSPLPQFTKDCSECREWRMLLKTALVSRSYDLEEWTIPFLDNLWLRLFQEPATLLHGDTVFSNAILIDESIALVDWEKARLGPASIDLGLLMEAVESTKELESYRHAFCQTAGRELSRSQVQHWADLGEGYNCLRWICYYIKKTSKDEDPGPAWRQNYYEPCLDRLRLLHKKRMDLI